MRALLIVCLSVMAACVSPTPGNNTEIVLFPDLVANSTESLPLVADFSYTGTPESDAGQSSIIKTLESLMEFFNPVLRLLPVHWNGWSDHKEYDQQSPSPA